MYLRFLRLLLVASVILGSAETSAQDTVPDNIDVDLMVGTTLPVSIGASATVHVPKRVFFEASLGWLPNAYVRTVNGVSTRFGFYDDFTADSISDSMQNGLAARTAIGWRPFKRRGFEISFGYDLIWAKGRVKVPFNFDDVPDSAPVKTTLHAVDGIIGGRWKIRNKILIRVGAGWLHRLRVKTKADATGFEFFGDAIIDDARRLIQDTLEEYGFTPLFVVQLGYRF